MASSGGAPSSGLDIINGNAGAAQASNGINIRAFFLNLATGAGLFAFQLTGFFLLKSSHIGHRIYQPKTYLVPERLRVEAIPVSPIKWIQRIFAIKGEELKLQGLDVYFAIRFIRAMLVIFLPLTAIIVTILLPVNYHGGKDNHVFDVSGKKVRYNVKNLDKLSWQNVAPTQTDRYWAHLVCALLAISWTLYRIYREKLHFVAIRQEYLTSPEYRLKASARTILVTNIPSEYRSEEALKALFDVFVDNDDRSKLHVWVNRDFSSLRKLVAARRKLCQTLEKQELKMLRRVNKKHGHQALGTKEQASPISSTQVMATPDDLDEHSSHRQQQRIEDAFELDCHADNRLWRIYAKDATEDQMTISKTTDGVWKPVSTFRMPKQGERKVPKIAWLRAEIARLTIEIEDMLEILSDTSKFANQNSAFIQFDRQMCANMACALTTHHKLGCMNPRYLHVAPHEILWPNMGLTSLARFIRTCAALMLFVGMIILWGIPATFLGILSQLQTYRSTVSYLHWLKSWPTWLISFISGPLSAILLALLIQLVVPALCRKLAVLVGTPTRSKRETVTQSFYFTFLFIELVLVTSISSGLIPTVSTLIHNPTTITQTLATELPKAANYFFNYLIIQALGWSGSVLFQYLRLLFITLIWPWFTQTPRQEAWLQTTIPHQMWANVICMWTNFAAIGLIYSVVSPLMLVFISAVFSLFWVAYRHNYFYVQRNKIDTHGLLFNNALSQLFAGVYVLEITLIGLFFIVRNTNDNLVCTPQAIIMIVALALTAAYHYVLESSFAPLVEMVPATLEDKAADAERERFLKHEDVRPSMDGAADTDPEDAALVSPISPTANGEKLDRLPKSKIEGKGATGTAASARRTMLRLHDKIGAKLATSPPSHSGTTSRLEAAEQLGEAIARYPDELIDLTPQERHVVLKAAYQDPVTREPQPIIWLPADEAGVSEDSIKQARKYGRCLQYSNEGAYLTRGNKCLISRPPPDTDSFWLLSWVL